MVFSSHSVLAKHPLFTVQVERLSVDERVALAYKRAKLVLQTHNLAALDVQFCSDRFWGLFTDPIICVDIGMFTILAAHIGLAIGTLSRHLHARPDLRPLVDELLRFDKVGLFLLTERGHGTDAFNIETTATRMVDGSYILNTPREEASKFMPASTPAFGISKVALVMAKLIENGRNFGCRYFIVPICNEKEMFSGVTSSRLPPRSGTSPLDFAITSFRNVHLPAIALVSSTPFQLMSPKNPLASWWDENWRIQRGTLLIVSPWSTASRCQAISSRRPITSAIAIGLVLEIWYAEVIRNAGNPKLPQHIQHAMAVIAKTTVLRHGLRIIPELAERCGAQGALIVIVLPGEKFTSRNVGTLEPNFMARIQIPPVDMIQNDAVGGVIAEGELLTLCIRLFSELLLGRYSINIPPPSESLLAQHAHGLLDENKKLLAKFGGHRSPEFNSVILPQSQAVMEAIGHALAYSAALKSNLPQPLLDVYECTVMRLDSAWYCVEAGISRLDQRMREDRAISSMLPDMNAFLSNLKVEELVTAPIVSDESWKKYAASLISYSGNAGCSTIAKL
ncbi:acyl-CoA oxidase [Mycena galopus ATCC 62051]|nr:acyl-CoA oxidase [Mycena galopus ATCC 62051]